MSKKSILTYYGGKQQLLPELLKVVPPHDTYIEPFAGGLSLYLNKTPVSFEVINDTNQMVICFYEVLRSDFENLKAKIEATLFSRASYKVALAIYNCPHLFTPLQCAWAFYYATQCGYAASIGSFIADRKGKRVIAFNNKKLRFDKSIALRLEKTLIENRDACVVIDTFAKENENAFVYCDPPYVSDGSTPKINQGHYKNYTLQQYEDLLKLLSTVKSKFLLSSYPSKLLEEYTKSQGWYTKTFEKPLSAQMVKEGGKRKTKKEVLTANYPI